jgi:hypothetical protein
MHCLCTSCAYLIRVLCASTNCVLVVRCTARELCFAGVHDGSPCSDAERICKACYCSALLFVSPFSDLSFCQGNLRRFLRLQSLNVALVGVTAVVNVLLELYSAWAMIEEVHTGRTAAEATTARAQFMAQFLNTVTVGVCFQLVLRGLL